MTTIAQRARRRCAVQPSWDWTTKLGRGFDYGRGYGFSGGASSYALGIGCGVSLGFGQNQCSSHDPY